jgi:hypothetical protein
VLCLKLAERLLSAAALMMRLLLIVGMILVW